MQLSGMVSACAPRSLLVGCRWAQCGGGRSVQVRRAVGSWLGAAGPRAAAPSPVENPSPNPSHDPTRLDRRGRAEATATAHERSPPPWARSEGADDSEGRGPRPGRNRGPGGPDPEFDFAGSRRGPTRRHDHDGPTPRARSMRVSPAGRHVGASHLGPAIAEKPNQASQSIGESTKTGAQKRTPGLKICETAADGPFPRGADSPRDQIRDRAARSSKSRAQARTRCDSTHRKLPFSLSVT